MENYIKGRGAQIRTENKFLKNKYVTDHIEGLDEPLDIVSTTQVFYEQSKTIVNKVTSPDLGMMYISITTLDEDLRRAMEPRTSSAANRLKTVETLTKAGVPVGVMTAPIIPGLNHHEIPALIKAAADHGALGAGMTVVRLNGSVGPIFKDWLSKNFPDRFDKVWNQISDLHGGNVNDSQFGRRMSGEGNIADTIHQLFRVSKQKHFKGRSFPPMDLTKFHKGGTLSLF